MLSLLIFLLTIFILVIVHEFGHYTVARACGVQVISFSVGFGPKLISYKSNHNEWLISAIPLGGYVRMLDERESPVPSSLKHKAFNLKAPWQKILIAFAGPLFNILFALFIYYILALNGVENIRPIVASINTNLATISHMNVPENSIITQINDKSVYSWENANHVFSAEVAKSNSIKITYTHQHIESSQIINLIQLKQKFNNKLTLDNLGIMPFKLLPIISYIEPSSPASKSGLKISDQIIQINQQIIKTWAQVADIIQKNPNRRLKLIVKRNNDELNLNIIPDTYNNDGQTTGKIGIMPTLDDKLLKDNTFIQNYTLITATNYAVSSSYNIIKLNISNLSSLINGKISWHNIGGPIAIANAGTNALNASIKKFIDFLALISLSLAFMNLLPIPILDGGHILIYLSEWITGHEINHKTQDIILKFGLVLILGLTFIALYNDALRLFSL